MVGYLKNACMEKNMEYRILHTVSEIHKLTALPKPKIYDLIERGVFKTTTDDDDPENAPFRIFSCDVDNYLNEKHGDKTTTEGEVK
jgi:hypothetical protein